MARSRRKPQQKQLPFRSWGGARTKAGRKPNDGKNAGVSHLTRAPLANRFPAHVTVKVKRGLRYLRSPREYDVIRAAFAAGCNRFGFRLVHYSVQKDHLHLIVEAQGRNSLSRGMQGLLIRLAKALNKLWSRKGTVFADRYHDHILRTPREVRNALNYVMTNANHHGARWRYGTKLGLPAELHGLDLCTSGLWFDGWRGVTDLPTVRGPTPVTAPHTWLIKKGWRGHGLLPLPPPNPPIR